MKPLSETYKELGIAFVFPIEIKDANGDETYFERSDGYWERCERDDNGNATYCEDSTGFWYKREYDPKRNVTYHQDSGGYWCKYEYDANGRVTYHENSKGAKRGTPKSAKTCEGKVIEVDGIKYKLIAQ